MWMTHREHAVIAGRTLAFVASVAAFAFVAACGGTPTVAYKPVVDVKQLMAGIVDPAADGVWESVATIFTKEGTEERRPRTEKEWAAVRSHAMTLAESGNLLMMPGRAKDGGDWMRFAQELVDTSAAALRAAEAKNVEGLLDVGGRIDQVCESCHKKYWPNY